jgi:hypothetical protein
MEPREPLYDAKAIGLAEMDHSQEEESQMVSHSPG